MLEVLVSAVKQKKRKQNHTDQKGRHKTVPICRGHDCLRTKSQGIYKNTPRTKKSQEGHRI